MNKKLKPANHSYSNTAQNDLPHNWRWWWRCPITTTQDIFTIDIRCDVLDNAEKSYLLWKFLPLCLEIFQQSSVCETHVKFLNITFGCFFFIITAWFQSNEYWRWCWCVMIAKHHWCRVTSNKSPVVVRFTDSVDRSNFRETNTREDWAQVKAELLCAKVQSAD